MSVLWINLHFEDTTLKLHSTLGIKSARESRARNWFLQDWHIRIATQIRHNKRTTLFDHHYFSNNCLNISLIFESFSSLETFSIVPLVKVKYELVDVVVLLFVFKFKGCSAFEYASKCSFFHTHAEFSTSTFLKYLVKW